VTSPVIIGTPLLQVLRQLCQGLAKCYSVAFENRMAVARAQITPHTLNFVRKLVSTFGVGIENVSNVTQTFSSAASESLARRVQVRRTCIFPCQLPMQNLIMLTVCAQQFAEIEITY